MSARPAPVRAAPRPPLAAYAAAWAVLATVYAALYTASGVPVFMAARGAVAAVLPDRAPRPRVAAPGAALAVADRRPVAARDARSPRRSSALAAGVDGGMAPRSSRSTAGSCTGAPRWPTADDRRLADRHQRADPRGAGGHRLRLAHGRGPARGARARRPGRRAAGARRAPAAALAAASALRPQRAPRPARPGAARPGARRERARAARRAAALRAVGAPDRQRLGAAVARVGAS